MKFRLTIALILLTVIFAVFFFRNKKKDDLSFVPDESIAKAILTFQSLTDANNYKELGLNSEKELKTLKPGIQFKNFMITIDQVKKFKAGEDIQKMIIEFPSIEVALVDSTGKVRTSIEFTRDGNKWIPVAFGASADLLLLSHAQARIPANILMTGKLIRMPSFEQSFFATPASNNSMMFYMLADNPSWSMQMGDTITAESVMRKLITTAYQHYGAP